MLNLYAVKVWHSSGPRHFESIEVRTYTARRAEHLAIESFPCCLAAAEEISHLPQRTPPTAPYFRPRASTLKTEAAASPQTGDVQGGVRGGSHILPLPPRQ